MLISRGSAGWLMLILEECVTTLRLLLLLLCSRLLVMVVGICRRHAFLLSFRLIKTDSHTKFAWLYWSAFCSLVSGQNMAPCLSGGTYDEKKKKKKKAFLCAGLNKARSAVDPIYRDKHMLAAGAR